MRLQFARALNPYARAFDSRTSSFSPLRLRNVDLEEDGTCGGAATA